MSPAASLWKESCVKRVKPLRHQFMAAGMTERCERCRVERSRSKGLPEYRLEGGTWSFADPGCRDPRQSDIFAPDLSLPEGFTPVEKVVTEVIAMVIEPTPGEILQKQIDEIFSKPRSQSNESNESELLDLDDVLSIFPGAEVSGVGATATDSGDVLEHKTNHHIEIHHEGATISLTVDPEGRYFGIQERWHVFASSPRPLAKGLEQIVEGTLGDAIQKSEWMKRVLVFRPEAILVVDGPLKRVELHQHPSTKKSKAFWSIHETRKTPEQEMDLS
jgi:hypothetical protein